MFFTALFEEEKLFSFSVNTVLFISKTSLIYYYHNNFSNMLHDVIPNTPITEFLTRHLPSSPLFYKCFSKKIKITIIHKTTIINKLNKKRWKHMNNLTIKLTYMSLWHAENTQYLQLTQIWTCFILKLREIYTKYEQIYIVLHW